MFRGATTRDVVQRLLQNKALRSLCMSEIFSVAPLLFSVNLLSVCLPGSSHGQCTQIHFTNYFVCLKFTPSWCFFFLFLFTQGG